MVLVDIYVPSVNNVYDFQLDEQTKVKTLIEEVAELIEQKEQCKMVGDADDLMLCLQKNKCILPYDKTLEECDVLTGSSLLLV